MAYRIAAIGLGGLTTNAVLPRLDDMDDVDIVAGADIDTAAGKAFEKDYNAPFYTDHETLLDQEELDGVYIATPHTLHYDQAIEAFDVGVDVLLEKPMVTDLDDAYDLVETAEDEGRTLAVGYQRHFDPAYQAVQEAVQDGMIGEPHTVSAYMEQGWYDRFKDAWRTDPQLSGGGELYDSGSHLLDAILWTTDTEPEQVTALMDQPEEGVDVNTAIAATLTRENGGQVTASISVTGDGRSLALGEQLHIFGTDGQIHVEDGTVTVDVYDGDTEEHTFDDRDFEDATEAKLADFIDASKNGTDPSVPGTYGRSVTALTEAAYRSYETGETVDVADLRDDA